MTTACRHTCRSAYTRSSGAQRRAFNDDIRAALVTTRINIIRRRNAQRRIDSAYRIQLSTNHRRPAGLIGELNVLLFAAYNRFLITNFMLVGGTCRRRTFPIGRSR